MSDLGRQALPMSGDAIRAYAQQVRDVLGFKKVPRVDCEVLLDIILPQALEGFEYEIREQLEMLNAEGYAAPDDRRIILREDVFLGACEGKGRDRFTIAHEIGHVLLHSKERLVHARQIGKLPAYACPEWQANTFASEFLIDPRQLPPSPSEALIMETFGVTSSAASVWLKRNGGKR
jgi:hypothetical protein